MGWILFAALLWFLWHTRHGGCPYCFLRFVHPSVGDRTQVECRRCGSRWPRHQMRAP